MVFILSDEQIQFITQAAVKSFKIAFEKEVSQDQVNEFIFNEKENNPLEINYIKRLFECAKLDFRAMKNLKKDENYALAVYHLQQAVEKLTKTYGLYTGNLEKNEIIKGIGHISPKTFVLLINKKNLAKKIQIILSASGQNNKVEDEMKKLNSVIENPRAISKLSKSEIISVVYIFNFIYKKIKKENKRGLRWRLYYFSLSLENALKSKFSDEEVKSISNINKNLSFIMLKNLDVPFIFMNLAMLSILTYPHASTTRYPKEDDRLEPQDYRAGLGIVDSLQDIENTLEKIFKRTEQLLSKVSEESSSKTT